MVQPDDRLGLFLEEAPAAVAYTFDPNVDEVLGTFYRKLFQLFTFVSMGIDITHHIFPLGQNNWRLN